MQNIWKTKENIYIKDTKDKDALRKDISHKMVKNMVRPLVESTSDMVSELSRLFEKEVSSGAGKR